MRWDAHSAHVFEEELPRVNQKSRVPNFADDLENFFSNRLVGPWKSEDHSLIHSAFAEKDMLPFLLRFPFLPSDCIEKEIASDETQSVSNRCDHLGCRLVSESCTVRKS
jgi:hypothetical protein